MTGVIRWNKSKTMAGADGWNLGADTGTALDTANVVVPVASAAERDGLTPPGGKYAGMLVSRTDLTGCPLQVWTGSRWAWTGVTRLGHSFTTPVSAAGTSYGTVASVTVTSLGGVLTLDYKGIVQNDSNDYRSADFQWLVDGTPFAGNTFAVPYIAGHQPPYSCALTRETTAAAGSHTIDLQTRASAVSAVINTAFAITIYENP